MPDLERDENLLRYAPPPRAVRPKITFSLIWEIFIFPFQLLIGYVVAKVGYAYLTLATDAVWVTLVLAVVTLLGVLCIIDAPIRLYAAIRTLRGLPPPQARWYRIWMAIQRRSRL